MLQLSVANLEKVMIIYNSTIFYNFVTSIGGGRVVAVRDGGTVFGSANVPIFLDDVVCTGNERNLLLCSHDRQHNCELSDLAGVVCDGEFNWPSRVQQACLIALNFYVIDH